MIIPYLCAMANHHSQGSVQSEVASGICTIVFSHPSHNAMPGFLLKELEMAIHQAGADTSIKVIVLKSGGERTFCAGASFDELISIENKAQGESFFMGFANVINAMRTCPKIIIGRVQGKVVGGGVGLAAATDYCLATKYAAVKLSELSIGIGPFVISPAVERKIGLAAFSHLSLNPTAWQSAEWAYQRGLYASVHEDIISLDVAVTQLARQLSNYNPGALYEMKAILWQGTADWTELLKERAKVSGELVLSDFTKRALKAIKK